MKEGFIDMRRKYVLLALACLMALLFGCGNPDDAVKDEINESEAEAETEDVGENGLISGGNDADMDMKESEEGDHSGRDLFADFIMGKETAVVSDDFLSAINMTSMELGSGKEYTISELEGLFQKDDFIGDTKPEISYVPLSIHDGALYAMRLYYETDIENITETIIFSDYSGKLEMIFAIDSWSRRSNTINEAGIVFDGGSNGAGSHSSVIYAPDPSFVYRIVSDLDEEYYGFHFYDEEGDPSDTVNAIMDEAGEGNEKAQDVVYYREMIDGRRYYYFLGGAKKLTQDTVEYIDRIADAHGFTFDGKAAADSARTVYEQKLEVEEACGTETEPHWHFYGK